MDARTAWVGEICNLLVAEMSKITIKLELDEQHSVDTAIGKWRKDAAIALGVPLI